MQKLCFVFSIVLKMQINYRDAAGELVVILLVIVVFLKTKALRHFELLRNLTQVSDNLIILQLHENNVKKWIM